MLDQDTRHFHLETIGCGFFTTQAMEVVLESDPGWDNPLEKGKAAHSSILGLLLWLSW